MGVINSIIYTLGIINFFRMSLFTLLTLAYDKVLSSRQLKKLAPKKFSKSGKRSYYRYNPLVSIIISAYNEEKVIQRTLTTLFSSTYKNFEVIVVNDGSKDNTDAEVKEFIKNNPDKKIVYHSWENKGKAHALNYAMKELAHGKIYMCLDADSVLMKDALKNAINYFRNPRIKALATNVKILPERSIMGIIQQVEYLMGYHLKKALTVGNIEYIIGGVGSMFRASIVKKVGYYSTDTVTEDIDLTMKVVRLGNKKNLLTYAEDVVVFTEGTITAPALFKQRFRWKFGRFQTFWKNRDLFFNNDKKYTFFLTHIYLPFQLFSEFTFLFDPLFVLYILILAFKYWTISSYYGMFLFLMFYTVIAIATDKESSALERIRLLIFSPLSYAMFFIVSIVEYAGLIKCIIRRDEIFNASKYNRCGWTPVARIGRPQTI